MFKDLPWTKKFKSKFLVFMKRGNYMSEECYCKQLHIELEKLPIVTYPFVVDNLPDNGIYFFYEKEEFWGHDSNKPRIVHVGTNRSDKFFKKRIQNHYIPNEKLTNFTDNTPKPSDSSILRKNIGYALLAKDKDPYTRMWNIKFSGIENRENFGRLRDIGKEKNIEKQISNILQNDFYFRFVEINKKDLRDGEHGLKESIIRTLALCNSCKYSSNWLGQYANINGNKLWQTDLYTKNKPLDNESWKILINAKETTSQKYSKKSFIE